MYIDSLACVSIKGGESEWFRMDSGVRQGCIKVYMDAVMKEVKMNMGIRGVRFMEEGRDWRLPGMLYANDLVLCRELEEDLRVMVGWYVEGED